MQEKSNNLFEQIADGIMRSPKTMLCAMLFIMGLSYSVISTFFALIFLPIAKLHKAITFTAITTGIALFFYFWQAGHAPPFRGHEISVRYWHKIFVEGYIRGLLQPWILNASLPAALFLSGVLSLIISTGTRMQKELKRVSKGEVAKKRTQLTKAALNKALSRIQSSAIENGSILGVNKFTGKPVALFDKDANLHTLAIGTTGSGKTTTILNIIESAITRKLPLFYVDGKGDFELACKVEAMAKAQNRPFYLFSMVGKSMVYNPIAFGGFTSKKDRIIELREWSEDHYRKIAEGYLQTVFKILAHCKIHVDLMTLANYMQPDKLFQLARDRNDSSLIPKIESLESKTRDISSLIAEIENMASSEIGHLFDTTQGNVITIDKILNEDAIMYFCLQPLAFPAYAETLGKLIINDLKALFASQLQSKDQKKIYCLFDEFSVFAGDQIINLINQGRSAGVHAVLATQSLSDIQAKGGNALLGQVLNNTNNYIIQRQNNPADAEVLANIIGTQDVFQITSQVITNNNQDIAGTIRETREFLVHPDEIKRLGVGEAIVVKKQSGIIDVMQTRVGFRNTI